MNETSRRRAIPLALACASILCAAQSARAQDPAPAATDELEEIVVTGYRLSLESSIAFKREQVGVVDSISAEEIGKLPDVSIADALARLPGLAAQRVDGRAQVISLRGMAPKYAVTLLNGREMVSTGDNRSVEYDQFPSELINMAMVYKTQDAALVSQGLSGTVDLATVRPLDYSEPTVTFGIRGEKNDNGELNDGSSDIGNRFSASYVDQFADGKFGVALGYAHLDNPGQEKYYKSWWWGDTDAWCGNQGYCAINGLPHGTPEQPGPGPVALLGFEAGVTSTDRKRDGVMGVLEYKPNETFHSMVDLYYSKFDQTSDQTELQAPLTTWDGIAYTDPVITEFWGNDVVTGGTITNAHPVVLNRHNDREDEVMAAGWRSDLTLGEWTLTGDLSYSKATRDEINSELTALAPGPTSLESIMINVDGGGVSRFTPSVDYGDPSVVLLTENWGRGGRSSTPQVEDEMKALALSASRALGGNFTSLDFGLSYSERTKDMDRGEVYYYLGDDHAPVMLADGDLNSSSSLGFVGIPQVINFDFNRVLGEYYTPGVPAALDQQPGRNWGVEEKVTRGFVKVNFDVPGTDERVRGNLGLQYVHTDQSSDGMAWSQESDSLVPVTGGTTYDDILPSLNVAVEILKNGVVRLGMAKEMARPNMEDMRAGFSASVSNQEPFVWSGSGGNPTLEPWRANAYDISVEYYLNKHSYLAAAVYYKALDSFVYSQTTDYDFGGVPNPGEDQPESTIGQMTRPVNGDGGYVKGTELSAVLDAGLFSDALEGFGVVASYSTADSNLHEENNPSKPLDGLSGDVRSIVLYFEKYGFSARVGERFRSKFQTTARNQFGDNQLSAISSESIVDAQIGYTFSSGMLDGLSILLQGNNLTDEPYRTSVGITVGGDDPSALMPERYNTYGRQYLLGLTYKL